jgi:glycosyltransferase involved in cell wall biosynthesis
MCSQNQPGRGISSPPRIIVFTRGYPPAHLVGGPARSLFALIEALAADFRFSVITSAFDGPAAEPMRSVKPDQWSTVGHATTWYERRYHISAWRAATLLKETKPQLIYLNSFFDYRFTILPLLLARITSRKTPVLLAPRGELSVGALALKWQKKRVFIAAFRLLGLHKAVVWHASTSQEKADIERMFGTDVMSHVAINLRADLAIAGGQCRERQPGTDPHRCSLVFFSRIVPKKNVATVIRALPLLKGKVHLSIAGPIQDARYWAECRELIDSIDDPEMVEYVGAVPGDGAVSFLSRFDLFVFPTLGENFGHVVFESLAAGTPVIVGNDTPWGQLETAGAGWICDPHSPEAVAELIERFLALDQDARMRMRTAARDLAAQVLNDPRGVDANRTMIQALISAGPGDGLAALLSCCSCLRPRRSGASAAVSIRKSGGGTASAAVSAGGLGHAGPWCVICGC